MIVYFSNVSNFTHKFVEKLEVPAFRIPLNSEKAGAFSISEPCTLFTPTYGANGRDFVPRQVIKFLNVKENRDLITGVVASGNINFLSDYCKAGDIISEKLSVPLLYRYELAGTEEDVEHMKQILRK